MPLPVPVSGRSSARVTFPPVTVSIQMAAASDTPRFFQLWMCCGCTVTPRSESLIARMRSRGRPPATLMARTKALDWGLDLGTPNYNMTLIPLSTFSARFPNAPLAGENSPMIQAKAKSTTVRERLALVRQATGCDKPADFWRWIEAKSAQAVDAWIGRNRITPEGALLIARATGASTHWLLFGDGEAFPQGPTPYPGAAQAGNGRVRALEAQVDGLNFALAQVIRAVSARLPGAGAELSAAIRSAGEGRTLPPQLVLLALAAEEAAQPVAPATPKAAPAASGAKPPRKGR